MAEDKGNKRTGVQTENTTGKRDMVSMTLMFIQVIFIFTAIVLVGQLFYVWLGYKPDPVYNAAFTPTPVKEITEPVRGSILARDGKILATSVPYFDVHMDCTAQKEEYESLVKAGRDLISRAEAYRTLAAEGKHVRKINREADDMQKRGEARVAKGTEQEREWLRQADSLSRDLASILGDRSAAQYFELITTGRSNGQKYVKICQNVDYATVVKLRQAHLFRNGRFVGGYIESRTEMRQYPYDNLARRVIGAVAENNEANSLIGLEGKYDYALKGREGTRWLKKTDHGELIPDYDSVTVKVRDGVDVRTTIDIEMQDFAHNALYNKILENDNIEGGCVIVMEVKTGAIRTMVNLERNKAGIPSEIYNHAVAHSGDPGSVFKLVTLMTLLEEKKLTSLETMVPTFGGRWNFSSQNTFVDEYLQKWPSREISVIDAFKISSNNVFRYLAWENYGDDPKHLTDKISEYKLTEAFDFDLLGCATPTLPTPGSPSWSGTALPSIAIGYSVNVTPLHIITLYNAVANKGKMMKPYLVESLEENGRVVEKHGPVILDGSICSTATADTLLRALCAVTTKGGTGAGLIGAKFKVAGKTGTAQIPFVANVGGKERVVYKDAGGNRRHQATFVGFFPAEEPKYTAIVVMYSRLGHTNLYGAAGVPVFRTIIDGIYALDEDIQEPLRVQKRRRTVQPAPPVGENGADEKVKTEKKVENDTI